MFGKKKKEKKVENCPICGALMNKKKMKDKRTLYKHSCHFQNRKHSILIYVSKEKK